MDLGWNSGRKAWNRDKGFSFDQSFWICLFLSFYGFVWKALGQRGSVDRSSAEGVPVLAGGT
jgi:hypothetical protein